MTSVFDGLAGVLNGVFGASVTWTPEGGSATAIIGVFREAPVRVANEDGGEYLLEMPTIQIQRPTADAVQTGDGIDPGNSKTYRVEARHASGSPAPDAFVIFELEQIT